MIKKESNFSNINNLITIIMPAYNSANISVILSNQYWRKHMKIGN